MLGRENVYNPVYGFTSWNPWTGFYNYSNDSLITSEDMVAYDNDIQELSAKKPKKKLAKITPKPNLEDLEIANQWDWRNHGMVNAVKHQSQHSKTGRYVSCGSCWAHAATDTIASAIAIQQKTTPMDLSVQ